jgi:hypothetical protein
MIEAYARCKVLASSDLKSRLKAGGIHLLGSLSLACLTGFMVFRVWYPSPLAQMQGVSAILLLMIGVDVVLGPLLTTAVFNTNKRRVLLKVDLGLIATVQLAAMLYGVSVIFAARPAVIVFNVDRFDVVAASDMQLAGLKIAHEQGKPGLPWFGPRIVAAFLPADARERAGILFSGFDLPQMAQWQVPYEDAIDVVKKKARPLSELKAENKLDDYAWREFLGSLGGPESDFAYLPMRARSQDGVMVINVKTTAAIKIVALSPRWR